MWNVLSEILSNARRTKFCNLKSSIQAPIRSWHTHLKTDCSVDIMSVPSNTTDPKVHVSPFCRCWCLFVVSVLFLFVRVFVLFRFLFVLFSVSAANPDVMITETTEDTAGQIILRTDETRHVAEIMVWRSGKQQRTWVHDISSDQWTYFQVFFSIR